MWFETFHTSGGKQVIKKSDTEMGARRLLRTEHSARLIAHIHHSFFYLVCQAETHFCRLWRFQDVFRFCCRPKHRRLQECCVHAEVTRLHKFRGFAKCEQPTITHKTAPMQITIPLDGCFTNGASFCIGFSWVTQSLMRWLPVAQGDEVRIRTRNKQGSK